MPVAKPGCDTQPPDALAPAMSTKNLHHKLLAEAIGTFALVFAGCGAIVVDQLSGGNISHTGVSLTFGLVVMVMVHATGHISGAHLNPAVSVAFAVTGRFPWREVPAYIASQIVAALAAAGLLFALFGGTTNLAATMPTGSIAQTVILEIVLTSFLMFVIMSVATDGRAVGQMAGWAIGGTIALAALFGGPISGASMNPARSIGPAFVAGNLNHLWLYLVAPLIGATLGALAYQLVRCGGEVQNAKGCC